VNRYTAASCLRKAAKESTSARRFSP
jgi:hypothetical protein